MKIKGVYRSHHMVVWMVVWLVCQCQRLQSKRLSQVMCAGISKLNIGIAVSICLSICPSHFDVLAWSSWWCFLEHSCWWVPVKLCIDIQHDTCRFPRYFPCVIVMSPWKHVLLGYLIMLKFTDSSRFASGVSLIVRI